MIQKIFESQYGYASVCEGPEERPERPRAAPRYLDGEALKKRFRWSDAQLEAALSHKFPGARRQFDASGNHVKIVWLDTEVERWAVDRRADIAQLSALLKHA